MPEIDIEPGRTLVEIVVAVVVAVLAYGATSVIALRRDIRKGKSDDLTLFNQVRSAATEQMSQMRTDIAEMHGRLEAAEARSEQAEEELRHYRNVLREALDHMGRLEATLVSQGINVPARPDMLKDVFPV